MNWKPTARRPRFSVIRCMIRWPICMTRGSICMIKGSVRLLLSSLVLLAGTATATTIDFAGINGSIRTTYTSSEGVKFSLVNEDPTGTGVFGAFLQIQNNGIEDG